MNRELTKREKTLLLILVVLVLVLGYCKLFLEPIDRQITSFRTNTDIEQAELDTDRVRLAQLEQMQQAIAAIKASDLPDRFLRPVPPDHRRAERQRQCQLPLQRGRAV